MHAYIHTCMHACMRNTLTNMLRNAYMLICTHMYTDTYTYIHIHITPASPVRTDTLTHMTHLHTHTCIRAYIQQQTCVHGGAFRMTHIAPYSSQVKNMQNAPLQKSKTKGGARKMLTWQEKLALVNSQVCRDFIATSSCNCKENCFQRIRQPKDKGADMVFNLREQRTQSTHIPPNYAQKNVNDSKSSITATTRKFSYPGCMIS